MLQRVLAVLAISVLLVGVSAGTALAGERVVRDARGDVWRLALTSDDATRAPNVAQNDVRRTSFRHGWRNFVVTSRYVELRRTGSYASFSTRLRTPRGSYREVVVETSPRSRRGTARVFNRGGRAVSCGVDHRIDYTRNTLRVSVPRQCLGAPRYVKATAASYWVRRGKIYADNPHNQGPRVRSWTRWIRNS